MPHVTPATARQVIRSTHHDLSPVFPLVLALTDDDAAPAAIRVTHALAETLGAVPTVLHVTRTEVTPATIATIPIADESELSPTYQTPALVTVESQVREALGALPRWRYEVQRGHPIDRIVECAAASGAELLVVGLPTHGVWRRSFTQETVLGVVQQTQTPILAVRPNLQERPAHVLVALDFSPASLRAAHLARHLLVPDGQLELIYVAPESLTSSDEVHFEEALAMLVRELAPATTMRVGTRLCQGSASRELVAYTERAAPDLVALGSGHHSPVDWFFGDSVSTEFVNQARWSMLIAPTSPGPEQR